MKKLVFIYSILCLALFSCADDNVYQEPEGNKDKSAMRFTLSIPEYKVTKTRASYENSVNDLWLMVFDVNGLFLERVQATNLISQENNGIGTGSFDAEIPANASIIHFIANYDKWATFDDKAAYQKDEREIVPALFSDKLMFWGRNTVTSSTSTVNVTLYRNQAKVTVENQAANFIVTGFAVANYITTGTVAPFNPDAATTPFVLMEDIPTLPLGTLSKGNQTDSDCTLEPKYMFENENNFNDQAYIILKGRLDNSTNDKYYKIQLLNSNKQPYPIVRSYNYKITIQSFSENANGSSSFEDAMTSEPSNNIYAEINKVSPTISDDENNVLTVGGVSYLFIQGGNIDIDAHYTKNGVPADTEIRVSIVEDQGNILHAVQYDGDGKIKGYVSIVPAGQQVATILVQAGILSRTITIISSTYYEFIPSFLLPGAYTGKDDDVTLFFGIPGYIPSSLYPIKCSIITKNLYPVEPNKDLQIEYSDGSYSYVYWATGPGEKNLSFKTSFDNSDETVILKSEYFITDSLELRARHFTDVVVNGSDLVNYGQGSTASLRFVISDLADLPAQYPLTVFIKTNNLTTTQTGWTKVSGGYTKVFASQTSAVQTVPFTSNTAISRENITISADGFSPTTIHYDNIVAQSVRASNNINVYTNGRYYTIPRYSVTSSNTSVVASFTASSSSTYTITIKAGAKLSDMVNFTSSNYNGAYTVEQLLGSPAIILQ